jgi:hypothetical protein
VKFRQSNFAIQQAVKALIPNDRKNLSCVQVCRVYSLLVVVLPFAIRQSLPFADLPICRLYDCRKGMTTSRYAVRIDDAEGNLNAERGRWEGWIC